MFPKRVINKSEKPYSYVKDIDPSLGGMTVNYSGKEKTLSEFIDKTDTTSFIIVKDNKIL